jgi:hypothetical protein
MKYPTFHSLVAHAHGIEKQNPLKCWSHYQGCRGDRVLYDVLIPDYNVRIPNVPVPLVAVIVMTHFHRDLEEDEVTDQRIRTYKVRFYDAVAFALSAYATMPPETQDYLRDRFGPVLPEAIQRGSEWWKGIETDSGRALQ